jgi:acetyltransferase
MMINDTPDIKYLFEPRSIAVIGASNNPNKIGYRILDNIISGGFQGEVHGINPKGGDFHGREMKKSIHDVEGEVDLAVISIPAKFVFESVKECGSKGVKFLVIITSGFSEVGNKKEERAIVEFAHSNGMRILGPNIFGIYSASASLNATFGSKDVLAGHVGIITQSGALGIAMIGRTAIEKIGLSTMVSLGNKSDIDENDLLQYLRYDPRTRVIMMYIEGVQNGERLIETLREVTREKPVIVIKSGRSKRGAMAAASHTGSLAGSDKVFDKVMKQCGVIRADTLEEAFNWSKFLSTSPVPKGENTVIVTNGGGVGVMATDACERFDVNLLDDITLMTDVFKDATPEYGSLKNPIDITGGAVSEDYDLAIGAGLETEKIDSVIALYCETAVFDSENLATMVEVNHRKYMKKGKPIVFSLLGGEKVEKAIESLKDKGIPVFSDVYETVQVLGALYKFYRYRNEGREKELIVDIDISGVKEVLDGARRDNRTFLLANESRRLMDVIGIPVPGSKVARNLHDAITAAEEIGYPVVMKVVSKDIIHKSDAGGVALDLENEEEVIDAYQAIMTSCRNYDHNAVIEGVEVAEMVKITSETIVGARQDQNFGPTIMFGMGGIYVEVLKDVSFRALPVDRREVLRMIKETKAYPLLLGVRGEPERDIDTVIDVIAKVGSLIRSCREITDIEINPLVAYEKGEGVKAVDVRVLISKEEV